MIKPPRVNVGRCSAPAQKNAVPPQNPPALRTPAFPQFDLSQLLCSYGWAAGWAKLSHPGPASGPGPSPSGFECTTSPHPAPYTQPSGLGPVPLAHPPRTPAISPIRSFPLLVLIRGGVAAGRRSHRNTAFFCVEVGAPACSEWVGPELDRPAPASGPGPSTERGSHGSS